MYSWEPEMEEEEDGREMEFGGKNVLIFLVDGSTKMQSKIFGSSKDIIGVVGFGTTNKVPEKLDFQHISELTTIGSPFKENILELESLLYDNKGKSRFMEKYGSDGEIKLHEVLWHCQSLISDVKGKVGSRRILLLTSNDDPHNGDETLNLQARRKAGDLHSNGIFLEVIPVRKPGDVFNMEKFYSDVVKLADDDWTGSVTSLDMLTETVLKKTFVKRTTSRLKFSIGGAEIGVATYNMLGRASKPGKMRLAADNNDEVKLDRAWVHPSNGAPLLPSDMARFMSYGGKNIKLSEPEVSLVKSFGEEGNSLKLLGFRPLSTLKFRNHVKIPQFLYPCENLVKGSRSLFSALVDRCNKKEKIAICSFKQRSSSGPSFVALVPQTEELDESGAQIHPPGFHVIYLPYLDDFRHIPERRLRSDNSRTAVDAAKSLISKLKLKKFIPVENPSIQSVYKMVESHALYMKTPEKVEDETLPDMERMKRKLGDRSQDFLDEVYDKGYDPSGPVKKAAKPKVSKEDKPIISDDLDMEALVFSRTVNKLTVDVLKAWLKTRGVAVFNKKKAELIEDVIKQFSS